CAIAAGIAAEDHVAQRGAAFLAGIGRIAEQAATLVELVRGTAIGTARGDDDAVQHGGAENGAASGAAVQTHHLIGVAVARIVAVGDDAVGIRGVVVVEIAGQHAAIGLRIALVADRLGAGKAAVNAHAGAD